MFTVRPFDAPLGAAIEGIDLKSDLGDELMRGLTAALYDHRVIVIKAQSLDEDAYLKFGRQWGEPIPHVLDHMRMPGYPEMMCVGNTEEKDKTDSIRLGAALWHTDQSYEQKPASATMLFALMAPRLGGETRFTDMAAAYEALDTDLKEQIDGYLVSHLYGAAKLREGEFIASPLINQSQTNHIPTCKHPLVLRHPVVGRKALYAVAQSAFAIEGLGDDEAGQLLWDLREHCIQDRFVYRHKYEIGDLVIFDSYSTMHAATPIAVAESLKDENARLNWRISVRGLPQVHREAAA
ncbi:MAG: TauD/TfdA family dioxygenase [Rhodospirillaceae bacterium]|nr:TauD/TfdA family dioxygenase [Rhodospirillaceae bacterium]